MAVESGPWTCTVDVIYNGSWGSQLEIVLDSRLGSKRQYCTVPNGVAIFVKIV